MTNDYPLRYAKHIAKRFLGREDPVWPLYYFEHSLHPDTPGRHDEILSWAEESLAHKDLFEAPERYAQSADPIVRQGYALKQEVERTFRGKRADATHLRLMLQIPDASISPGGFSLLSNFAESFEFIGIPVYSLGLEDDTREALETFRPTIFLSIGDNAFLKKIDWLAVADYRKTHDLRIGLNARLEEEEVGNPPLIPRLDWAQAHGVDFFFSFRDEDYIHTRKEYQPFFERGYSILTIPFGANPLHYYPIPEIQRDINFSLLASGTWKKGVAYQPARDIVSRYSGFIDGIGWRHVKGFTFMKDRDRYIYARSKVGLNFHLPEQIEWACEVNERTHQLAMCGLPQLLDPAKLLPKLYSEDAMFVCRTSDEFVDTFEHILADPAYGQERALRAQREVFERHTTFHRADAFATQLTTFLTTR